MILVPEKKMTCRNAVSTVRSRFIEVSGGFITSNGWILLASHEIHALLTQAIVDNGTIADELALVACSRTLTPLSHRVRPLLRFLGTASHAWGFAVLVLGFSCFTLSRCKSTKCHCQHYHQQEGPVPQRNKSQAYHEETHC